MACYAPLPRIRKPSLYPSELRGHPAEASEVACESRAAFGASPSKSDVLGGIPGESRGLTSRSRPLSVLLILVLRPAQALDQVHRKLARLQRQRLSVARRLDPFRVALRG